MRDATHAFLAHSRAEHARLDYESDPRRLAHLLGIEIIPGRRNRASAGPPALITLARDHHVATVRFTLFHEINHVIMQRVPGLEEAVLAEVDGEDAGWHLERVVNHAAAQMLLPDPMVNIISGMYGETPQAILNLAKACRASLPAALHRWASHDPEAERAGFLTSGSYIAHVATCNVRLPFGRYDRVPEPDLAHRGVVMAAVSRNGRRIGVLRT